MNDLGTLLEHDGRWMLRFERWFPHPPSAVWALISEARGLETWFPARIQMSDAGVGASLTFVFADEDLARAEAQGVQDVPKHSTGVVREIEVGRVFAFDWENELIRMELIAEKDGCRLIFTHVFDRDRAQAPRNASGWHSCLDALGAALSKEPATEPDVDELVKFYTLALEHTEAFKNHTG